MINNLKTCLEYLKKESTAHPNREIVGFLGIKENKPVAKIVKNRASDPQKYFSVDPLELLDFQNNQDFLAIFHSHIYGDSQFSEWDTVTSDNCLIPFVVYSLPEDRFNIYVPNESLVEKSNLEFLRAALND